MVPPSCQRQRQKLQRTWVHKVHAIRGFFNVLVPLVENCWVPTTFDRSTLVLVVGSRVGGFWLVLTSQGNCGALLLIRRAHALSHEPNSRLIRFIYFLPVHHGLHPRRMWCACSMWNNLGYTYYSISPTRIKPGILKSASARIRQCSLNMLRLSRITVWI